MYICTQNIISRRDIPGFPPAKQFDYNPTQFFFPKYGVLSTTKGTSDVMYFFVRHNGRYNPENNFYIFDSNKSNYVLSCVVRIYFRFCYSIRSVPTLFVGLFFFFIQIALFTRFVLINFPNGIVWMFFLPYRKQNREEPLLSNPMQHHSPIIVVS